MVNPVLTRPAINSPEALARVVQDHARAINELVAGPLPLRQYLKADLPAAADFPGHLAAVTDEAGGYTVAFSDGTDWRRVQDRAIVS